jgi:hypothetical protein
MKSIEPSGREGKVSAFKKRMVCVAAVCLLSCSCGDKMPDRKPTFPVTGKVQVDGQPAAQLSLTCHDVKGVAPLHPTVSSAITDPDGKFAVSTYQSGDGVPEGEYVLTFVWGKFDLISKSYGGADRLKGRYRDPEAGKPIDLGCIELSTK